MDVLTQQDVLSHQHHVPWPSLQQVEQDLLLCRSMAAIFNDEFLSEQVAMRGGTLLHKVYLSPPSRFSEDIDLVVIGDRPKEHIQKALRRVLADVLGKPETSVWNTVKLAVRNAVRPSEILKMYYELPSVSTPGMDLRIIVEGNVTERVSHRPKTLQPFSFSFRNETVSAPINGFDIHEMLGTKMRALFQRRRGRDLFDLYWALETDQEILPASVIDSFLFYMEQEGTKAHHAEFTSLLQGHLADRGFCSDTNHLLLKDIVYDPHHASKVVEEKLLSLLPDGP